MSPLQTTALSLGFLICLCATSVRAAIINVSGTWHASATIKNGGFTASDNPADKAFPAFTSASASASAGGGTNSASASFNGGSLSGSTNVINGTFNGDPGGSASAGGTMTFTETEDSIVHLSVSGGGKISGGFSVLDSFNVLIASAGIDPQTPSGSANASLPAGNYTLSWSVNTQRTTSVGGTGSLSGSFSATPAPEPTLLGVIPAGLMFLSLRRNRR